MFKILTIYRPVERITCSYVQNFCIMLRVRKIAKGDYWLRHVSPPASLPVSLSVCPHGSAKFPPGGVS